ncbi:hypothetical protein [Anabaena sp. CS-542/02]|uniref:hypothetical protein n=1 Tax=Anabaena sp. CS-542/02 TaxID=3021719 RepID=UPI00232C5DAC|nr:hypothetical protein [Anabaena sp. CS-542/02]MDB9445472.1 hypothetical protein [Anabaena sp. CS-542/02]
MGIFSQGGDRRSLSVVEGNIRGDRRSHQRSRREQYKGRSRFRLRPPTTAYKGEETAA